MLLLQEPMPQAEGAQLERAAETWPVMKPVLEADCGREFHRRLLSFEVSVARGGEVVAALDARHADEAEPPYGYSTAFGPLQPTADVTAAPRACTTRLQPSDGVAYVSTGV